jgi:hypothetical protein
MKKTILGSLFWIMAGMSSVIAADISSQPCKNAEYRIDAESMIINLAEVEGSNYSAEEITYVLEHLADDSLPIIFEIPSGWTFSFDLKGDFFVSEPMKIRLQKPCFLKFAQGELLLSGDLYSWEPFMDFFTGGLSINVENSKVLGLDISLNLELSKR